MKCQWSIEGLCDLLTGDPCPFEDSDECPYKEEEVEVQELCSFER